ncbi:enoyl-CoA hydratase [Alicycliphilus sp. B1]|nr:enoyl-CoA hydratase [Alicycliphilus sp. B1]
MQLVIDTRLPGGVRRITLNRPEAKNAFDAEMMQAISQSFRDAAKDPETRSWCSAAQAATSARAATSSG